MIINTKPIKTLFILTLLQIMIITKLSETSASLLADQCHPDIGCFPITQEFYHPRHRPWNVRPWPRHLIGTKFELFNKKHPQGYMLKPWNRLNLFESQFNPNWETKIIVPGWLDNIKRTIWIRQMKDAFLWLWKPVNVIVVHWINFIPYSIATANTRIVGAELANLIKFIEHEFSYNRTFYHMIGHSLGAHISGYAGTRMPGLGRITALDPARPFFQHMPKSIRLDRGDACFVDAIHSDFTPENAVFLLMSYGMTTPVGHLDFYPNGPPVLQPGCLRDSLRSIRIGMRKGFKHNSMPIAFLEAIRYLSACDHQRAHEYYIESITNTKCAFVGVRCDSFEGLINGRCTCDNSKSACSIMGAHANQMYKHNLHQELWPAYPEKWVQHSARNNRKQATRIDQEFRAHLRNTYSISSEFEPYESSVFYDNFQEIGDWPLEQLESISYDDIFYNYLKLGLLQKFDQYKAQLNNQLVQETNSNILERIDKRQSSSNEDDDLGLMNFLLPDTSNNPIEKWYEKESRWFLKTNNKPKYCVNQYQVLVYLGDIRSTGGLLYLRANFVITIIGTKGRIVNQHFKPRHPNLSPYTMQPFFMIIDGFHSLGDIVSVGIAWEQRIDKDPIQATISFESKILETLQPMLPSYKARHPWLSETIRFDYTKAFRYNNNNKPAQYTSSWRRSSNSNFTQTDSSNNPTDQKPEARQDLFLKLHNIPLHKKPDLEDSIVIKKVVVIPLRASYGKNKAAKTFCPPRSNFAIQSERTLPLQPNPLDDNCLQYHFKMISTKASQNLLKAY